MSIAHHPDFSPERPGPKEFVVVDERGYAFTVLDGEPLWFAEAWAKYDAMVLARMETIEAALAHD